MITFSSGGSSIMQMARCFNILFELHLALAY